MVSRLQPHRIRILIIAEGVRVRFLPTNRTVLPDAPQLRPAEDVAPVAEAVAAHHRVLVADHHPAKLLLGTPHESEPRVRAKVVGVLLLTVAPALAWVKGSGRQDGTKSDTRRLVADKNVQRVPILLHTVRADMIQYHPMAVLVQIQIDIDVLQLVSRWGEGLRDIELRSGIHIPIPCDFSITVC